MTYEEFRKAHPATRCFQRYDHEQRANRAASHRLGQRQRAAIGEFYYTHEMVPGVGFGTAKAATTRAYEMCCSGLRVEMPKLRFEDASEAAAEQEALTVEQNMSDETMAALEAR